MLNDLFEQTKHGIREILEEGFLAKIKKFKHDGFTYNFEHEDVMGMLPNIQAINLGILDEVTVLDENGAEVVMTKEEYLARNNAGFINKSKNELDLIELKKILEAIQTFTALAHFGSFDMAKKHFLNAEEEEPEMEEIVTEEEEEVIEE